MFNLIRFFLPYGYDIIPVIAYYALNDHGRVCEPFQTVIYLYVATRIGILVGKCIASFMTPMFFSARDYGDAFIKKLQLCFGPQTISVAVACYLVCEFLITSDICQ